MELIRIYQNYVSPFWKGIYLAFGLNGSKLFPFWSDRVSEEAW